MLSAFAGGVAIPAERDVCVGMWGGEGSTFKGDILLRSWTWALKDDGSVTGFVSDVGFSLAGWSGTSAYAAYAVFSLNQRFAAFKGP